VPAREPCVATVRLVVVHPLQPPSAFSRELSLVASQAQRAPCCPANNSQRDAILAVTDVSERDHSVANDPTAGQRCYQTELGHSMRLTTSAAAWR